jgi:hypothetical protein
VLQWRVACIYRAWRPYSHSLGPVQLYRQPRWQGYRGWAFSVATVAVATVAYVTRRALGTYHNKNISRNRHVMKLSVLCLSHVASHNAYSISHLRVDLCDFDRYEIQLWDTMCNKITSSPFTLCTWLNFLSPEGHLLHVTSYGRNCSHMYYSFQVFYVFQEQMSDYYNMRRATILWVHLWHIASDWRTIEEPISFKFGIWIRAFLWSQVCCKPRLL